MLVEELLAIVVRDFFSCLDVLNSEDVDAAILEVALAIGCAGVVDVLGSVFLDVAVDHRGVTCPEEIFAAVSITLSV